MITPTFLYSLKVHIPFHTMSISEKYYTNDTLWSDTEPFYKDAADPNNNPSYNDNNYCTAHISNSLLAPKWLIGMPSLWGWRSCLACIRCRFSCRLNAPDNRECRGLPDRSLSSKTEWFCPSRQWNLEMACCSRPLRYFRGFWFSLCLFLLVILVSCTFGW